MIGREEYQEGEKKVMIHSIPSVKDMTSMAASGSTSLVFIDDMTAYMNEWMTSEVYKAILCARVLICFSFMH